MKKEGATKIAVSQRDYESISNYNTVSIRLGNRYTMDAISSTLLSNTTAFFAHTKFIDEMEVELDVAEEEGVYVLKLSRKTIDPGNRRKAIREAKEKRNQCQ